MTKLLLSKKAIVMEATTIMAVQRQQPVREPVQVSWAECLEDDRDKKSRLPPHTHTSTTLFMAIMVRAALLDLTIMGPFTTAMVVVLVVSALCLEPPEAIMSLVAAATTMEVVVWRH